MPHRPRLLAGFLVAALAGLLGPGAGLASATTIADLIKLKASTPPVSDEVLIALIESDGSIFRLTADDIQMLRQKGLSNDVVIAMLATATRERERERQRLERLNDELPAVVPVEQPIYTSDPTPQGAASAGPGMVVTPSPQPISGLTPYYVTTIVQTPRHSGSSRSSRASGESVVVPVAVPVAVPVVRRPPPEPVYWGFGGQRRPDTWAPAPDQRPPAPPATPATTDNRTSRTGRGGR